MKQTLSSLSGDTIKAIVLVCLAVGVVGMSYGSLAVAYGFPLWVPLLLSVSVLAGASEFMFIGIVASGGSPLAAAAAGLLVNARHIPFGVTVRELVGRRALSFIGCHIMNDESVVFGLSQPTPAQRKAAYWLCGAGVALIWPLGTLTGAAVGKLLPAPETIGLDAVFPAILLALVIPAFKNRTTLIRAASGAALALAAALCLALAACGPKLPGTNSGSSSAVSTPAASGSGSVSGSASVSSGGAGDTMSEGQRYAYAIRDARPAEDNEYSEIACGDAGGEPMLAVNPNDMSAEDAASSIQMMLDTMGIDPATLDAYAFSMSMMNVRAYAIGVFKPAEGQAEAVQAAVESYVSLQRKSFENYLADQYEVAKGALIKTLPGGEIVLVMSEGAADIMANLEKTLK